MSTCSRKFEADVVIVGSGAAGAAIAWRLSYSGMRIVCLEQGGFINPREFPCTQSDWEAKMLKEFSFNPNIRASQADYPVNDDESPIKIANFNGVGGGTILYSAHFPRFQPSDFRVKTLDGIADDWPLDYFMLEKYYKLNEKIVGVSGLSGDPAYPHDSSRRLPPLPLGKSGQVLAKGFNSLGWHWWPSDTAILTEAYGGRSKCINLGTCNSGCAHGAKGSADITYWPMAIRRGVELKTKCRVHAIKVNGQSKATGVVYFDDLGNEHEISAAVIVLACNGIGTPRLLLNSKCKSCPDGVANSSGLVGRNLMLHPYTSIQGLFDEPLDGHVGPLKSIRSHEFYQTDFSRGFIRGYTLEATRGMPPVRTATVGARHNRVPWGATHHHAYRKMFGKMTGFVAICEDLPNQHNRVTLDSELRDSSGIPAPRIEYKISSNSLNMMEHSISKASEVLLAAGAHDILVESPLVDAGWHHLGTARMGNNNKTSVVNSWGQSHDVKNLFIADGSIFVTGSGVNPTNTIQALALYIGDEICKRADQLFKKSR